jgi:hypothetical protein
MAIFGVDMMQRNAIKSLENHKIRPATHDMIGEDHAAYVR